MSSVFRGQYLDCFNNFLKQLKVMYPNDNIVSILNNLELLSDEDKLEKGQKFNNLVTDDNIDLLVKSKLKLFSHKNPDTLLLSETLLNSDLNLKKLLNNQSVEVKQIIWAYIHKLCFTSELQKNGDDQSKLKVDTLSNLLCYDTKQKLEDILGVKVNDTTTDMINEIVSLFENTLKKSDNTNPMANILEISQLISVKYADKISSGEIELDKLMKSIMAKIPGMDKMMDQMGNMSGMGNLEQMMGNLMGKSKPKEKVIIDETFSTANVDVVEDNTKSSNFDIGKILKVADQFGVIPGGNNSQGNSQMPQMDDIMKLMSNFNLGQSKDGKTPDMSKMMNMMNKLGTTTTKEDKDNLKLEMDSFLEKEMGVDVEQLNQQLQSITHKFNNDIKDVKL